MKKWIYFLGIIFILGCEKEDTLDARVYIEKLYTIADDPSDPVQHRRYGLYEKYGVPVYFNDTIGKVFVSVNVRGDSIFRYETINQEWNFTSYSGYRYKYEYITDPEVQLNILDMVEEFLKLSDKALYPFSFFAVDAARMVSKSEDMVSTNSYIIGFRNILLTGKWPSDQAKNMPGNLMREMVKTKIQLYVDDLGAFNAVSDQIWYGMSWPNAPSGFTASCLSPTWWGVDRYPPEEVEARRQAARLITGPYGFVCGDKNSGGYYAPGDYEWDLDCYIAEMLHYTPEEFKELWGEYPLVMRKYEILYAIIQGKLGVTL